MNNLNKNNNYAITASKIFTGQAWLKNSAVVISNGIIIKICALEDLDKSLKLFDFKEHTITAGFVDLQLNGAGGVLFNDDISSKTLETIHLTNLKYGTTSFLPTLISTTEHDIKKALEVVKNYIATNNNGNYYSGGVIGIHLEGPYISKEKKGIHNAIYIQSISKEMVDYLCNYAKYIPIKITLAPEEVASEHIVKLTSAGVVVSIGHSNATYNQAQDGINHGIKLATHLFNAMSPLEGRNPGVVGAVLNNNIYSSIIADGHHVDFNSIALVHKIKTDKLYLVTDAVTPLGTTLTEFQFAGQTIFVKDGKCVNANGTLAGANIDMLSSVVNIINHCNLPIETALAMANLNPISALQNSTTNNYGHLFNVGSIKIGNTANFAIIHLNDNKCVAVLSGGNLTNF